MSVALWRMRGCWVESTHIKVYQSGTAVFASTLRRVVLGSYGLFYCFFLGLLGADGVVSGREDEILCHTDVEGCGRSVTLHG